MHRPGPALAALLLAALALAGCTGAPQGLGLGPSYASLGFDGTTWPDLHGAKVRVLAYDAFAYAFGDAEARFENLTNGTVELLTAPDAGGVLERAVREKGDPSFDVLYGIDNVLHAKAVREGVFQPYRPLLAAGIEPAYLFTTGGLTTPVNHGYIGVNVDPRANLTVRTLDDLKAHAGKFVTEDPRTSTPGLGFLLATIATYGEAGPGHDYLDYWGELFRGGVLVTPTWTEAYAARFTGGYGQFEEGAKVDKPLVTSYTTSPAYEVFYGGEVLNHNLLAPKATFHQIQTMGIAKGAENLAAAQAWMEFALTPDFQELAAAKEAIYPVVEGVGVEAVFQGLDPAPGTFEDTGFSAAHLGANVERWLREWTDAYERARA